MSNTNMNSDRRSYGDQRSCVRCGCDVEWHGREHGWSDRGGNKYCDTSGHSPVDENGMRGKYPHKRHTVPSDLRYYDARYRETLWVDGFQDGKAKRGVSYYVPESE